MHVAQASRWLARLLLPALICWAWSFCAAAGTPPFQGTVFVSPDIITAADPNALLSVTYAGQGTRNMFDRRCNCFADYAVYLFDASYQHGFFIEVDVDAEYGSESAAQVPAQFYAREVGYLPLILRTNVDALWIHQGDESFGGSNHSILIHTGSVAHQYISEGILEEALAHEATHTSLDALYLHSDGWIAAQQADGSFISTYAAQNPMREDLAESFLMWFAVRHSAARLDPALVKTIEETIPHRMAFLDARHFLLYPDAGTKLQAARNRIFPFGRRAALLRHSDLLPVAPLPGEPRAVPRP